jgi:hypothetical protein
MAGQYHNQSMVPGASAGMSNVRFPPIADVFLKCLLWTQPGTQPGMGRNADVYPTLEGRTDAGAQP